MSLSSWKRSFLTKRIVKNQLDTKEDEIKISNGIVREDDGIRFQKQLRSRIRELVQLQKQHSKRWKKWTKKCQKLEGMSKSIYKVDETISQLLGTANLANDNLIKQNDNFIEALTKVYKSIPKKEQFPSLKSKLKQEHKNTKKIKDNRTESIKELTKQRTQLREKLDAVKIADTNRCLDKSERDKLRRQRKLLSTQRMSTNRQIKTAHEDCDKATNSYTITANNLLKDSQQYQTISLKSLKDILQNYINALRIESPVFNQTTQKIKPSKKSIQSRKQNRSHSTTGDDNDDDDGRSIISIDSD